MCHEYIVKHLQLMVAAVPDGTTLAALCKTCGEDKAIPSKTYVRKACNGLWSLNDAVNRAIAFQKHKNHLSECFSFHNGVAAFWFVEELRLEHCRLFLLSVMIFSRVVSVTTDAHSTRIIKDSQIHVHTKQINIHVYRLCLWCGWRFRTLVCERGSVCDILDCAWTSEWLRACGGLSLAKSVVCWIKSYWLNCCCHVGIWGWR